MFWKLSREDLVRGFSESETAYVCAFCKESYEKGRIYPVGEALYDAKGAAARHVQAAHGSAADYLLDREPGLLGISEMQSRLLKLISQGRDDREIAAELDIAASTVRGHRFKLREKEKQARLFLAMMESLEQKTSRSVAESGMGELEEVHASATMLDERYSITQQEKEKTIQTYMDETGGLRQFPAREKKKIIVLREIAKNFKSGREYSEKEVNRTLKRIYEADVPTVRRYLIEYGFLERSKDGSVYRVKE